VDAESVCVVVLDSLEGRGGCAQGGVDWATWVSFDCCSVVPEALTAPLRVLFLPVIAAI
jgi:hypothetical protein